MSISAHSSCRNPHLGEHLCTTLTGMLAGKAMDVHQHRGIWDSEYILLQYNDIRLFIEPMFG